MLRLDRNALLCDFAQYYHVYDLGLLPKKTVATLAAGLGDESRIKTKMYGLPVPLPLWLDAMAVDLLNIIAWQRSKNGEKGINKPKSIVAMLKGENAETRRVAADVFNSPEEFMKARAELVRKAVQNG